MFNYMICNQTDENIFYKQCSTIEKHISSIEKGSLLEDVDGGLYQSYSLHGKSIVVKNSYSIGSVYIESEIDLEPFF